MKKRGIKGNIILLVVFVLFVTSLIWLLVTHYVKNMITVSSLFTKYYTTYFHAYWWLEMGLSLINYRVSWAPETWNPFWYEDTASFTGYGNCNNIACWYDIEIHSRGGVLSDSAEIFSSCDAAYYTGWAAWEIAAWDWFIVPLFYDVSTGFSSVDYERIWGDIGWEFTDLDPQLYNTYAWVIPAEPEEYIVRIVDEQVENYDVFIEPTVSTWWFLAEAIWASWSWLLPYTGGIDNKNYLIVANATWSTVDFCLQLDGVSPSWGPAELPSQYMRVQSLAEFSDVSVAFWAIKANKLPSYLIYWTINP